MLALMVVAGSLAVPSAAGATVFAVNSTADAVDRTPSDGACSTAAQTCTLRAAVQQANASGGEDRITLGVAPKGGVRVVLHRGAKVPDADQFSFDDKAGLAKWPSPGRGVIQFGNAQEIEPQREALADLFRRWLAATA